MPPNPVQVLAGAVTTADAINPSRPTGQDARMETKTSHHRPRTKTRICLNGAVSAIETTTPGTGTGDLVLLSVAPSEEGANKTNNNYSLS